MATKRFSKAKWLLSANAQMEAGRISQREIEDALAIWVNALDGKTEAEIQSSGQDVSRQDWFE